MLSISKQKVLNFLTLFILVDILFFLSFDLPLLPTMPVSLLCIIFVLIFYPNIIKGNYNYKVFVILLISILLSMGYGIIFKPDLVILGNGMVSTVEYNLKRTLQFLLLFAYYFYLTQFHYESKWVKRILIIFIFWYISLGLISAFNLGLYFNIHDLFYGSTISKVNYYLNYEELNVFRYRYFFLDANTSIYFFQMIAFYLLLNEKNGIYTELFIHLMVIIGVLLSKSTGATLSAISFYTLYFIIFKFNPKYSLNYTKKEYYKRLLKFILVIIVSLFVLLISINSNGVNLDNIEFFEAGYDRISNNDDGGRLQKYVYMFSDRLPFIFGEGYVLIRNDKWFRPHSDILRFLYSYGIIAFIAFFYMFRQIILSPKGLFIIPALWAFGINSLIDDQKMFAMFLILIAITTAKLNRSLQYKGNNDREKG